VQKVLQNLLRERVSIRDGVSILEAMSESSALTRNPILITEFVRQSIRRTITKPLLGPNQEIQAWVLNADLEQELESAVEHGELNSHISVSPSKVRELLQRCRESLGSSTASAVLLTGSNSRYFVRQFLESAFPNLHVLSHAELAPGVQVKSLGQI
jgi:flagellar biosynthesis protein FlhA